MTILRFTLINLFNCTTIIIIILNIVHMKNISSYRVLSITHSALHLITWDGRPVESNIIPISREEFSNAPNNAQTIRKQISTTVYNQDSFNQLSELENIQSAQTSPTFDPTAHGSNTGSFAESRMLYTYCINALSSIT